MSKTVFAVISFLLLSGELAIAQDSGGPYRLAQLSCRSCAVNYAACSMRCERDYRYSPAKRGCYSNCHVIQRSCAQRCR
jgi:hypothetical protein